MKHLSSCLAIGLLLSVVLACSFVNKSYETTNSGGNGSAGSGAVIEEVHMAEDSGNGQPGASTNLFSPENRTIHCVAKLADAKSGTTLRFSWFIVDAGGSQNQKVKDIDYTTSERENVVHSNLTLPNDWPTGKYKVEVFVNGKLEKTAQFSVR
jgi:hypothetical protein